MAGALRIEYLRGEAIASRFDALAALRIAVFQEWPYLYSGDHDYEMGYLDLYRRSQRSLAVLIWQEDRCIGASTVLPLADAGEDAQRPFIDGGHDVGSVDYFGESVILAPFRGRGIGVRFFEAREAHAREHQLPVCAFCSVSRPADHPQRPLNYAGNDAFWQRRGYRAAPEINTTFSWPDLGNTESTAKPMTFWLRDLRTPA